MEGLIGNAVSVTLKGEDETLHGLLIHVEEHYVYVQMEDSSFIYVVPKNNVKYYVTNTLPGQSRLLSPHRSLVNDTHVPTPPVPEQQAETQPKEIVVFVNGDRVTQITAPSQVDTSKFNHDIMRLVLSSKDVQTIVAGRKQKEFRYDPGEAHIVTVSEEEESVGEINAEQRPDSSNTFSMGSPVVGNYLSGEQMVERLQQAVTRGTKK